MTTPGYLKFALAAAVSGTLALAGAARAGWDRHSPIECVPGPNVTVLDQAANNGSLVGFIDCPIPDSEARQAHTLNGGNVFGYDGSTVQALGVATCQIAVDGTGAGCSGSITGGAPVSDVKQVAINFPASNWVAHSGKFKFIDIALPGVDSGRVSKVWGYTTF
jgi:hypothetical protein